MDREINICFFYNKTAHFVYKFSAGAFKDMHIVVDL